MAKNYYTSQRNLKRCILKNLFFESFFLNTHWQFIYIYIYIYIFWSTEHLSCSFLIYTVSFIIYIYIYILPTLESPEYLARETAQVFIPLINFLLLSLILRSFLLLRYSFVIFFSSVCLMVSTSNIHRYL